HLLGRIRHRIAGDDGKAGFSECLFAGLDIIAFQTHHQRQFKPGLAHGGDNAGGDDVAIHDAAENIHQYSLHIRVAQYDAESGRDLFLARATADIKEVGRTAAEMLDDVHRGHRETGAIDQAGDVAIELDVIQVELTRLD